MVPSLDVFTVKDGEPKWLGCADTLAQAVELFRKTGSGSYFVFSQVTEGKDFYEVSGDGVVSQVVASAGQQH